MMPMQRMGLQPPPKRPTHIEFLTKRVGLNNLNRMHPASSRRFVWLALLLALFQASMPLAAYGRSAGGPASLLIEICVSGGGSKRVSVGADGVPVEAPGAESHASHCPLCAGSATPQVDHTPMAPPATAIASVSRRASVAGSQAVRRVPPATGPPSLS